MKLNIDQTIEGGIENSLEQKIVEYRSIVTKYLCSEISVEEMFAEMGKIVRANVVDEVGILTSSNPSDRFMVISNHAKLDDNLCVPAVSFSETKGGNSFHFPRMNFPALRQLLLRKMFRHS